MRTGYTLRQLIDSLERAIALDPTIADYQVMHDDDSISRAVSQFETNPQAREIEFK